MGIIESNNPVFFATSILITASIFTVVWYFDSLTHAKMVKVDLTDKELQTHRNILFVSLLMEGSLGLMYWFDYEVLALFIALFITRTVHEFIDELHFHTERCSPYESMLHIGMWVTVLTKTSLMFMWGFFHHYNGIWELHPGYFVWGFLVLTGMSWISHNEWKRAK